MRLLRDLGATLRVLPLVVLLPGCAGIIGFFGFCGLCGGDQQISLRVTSPAAGTVFDATPVVIEFDVDGTDGGASATAFGPGPEVTVAIADGASSGTIEFLPAVDSGPITIEVEAQNSDHWDDENDLVMVEWVAPWVGTWRRSYPGCTDPSCYIVIAEGTLLTGTVTMVVAPTYDAAQLDGAEVRLDGLDVTDLSDDPATVRFDVGALPNGPVDVTAVMIRDDSEATVTSVTMMIDN